MIVSKRLIVPNLIAYVFVIVSGWNFIQGRGHRFGGGVSVFFLVVTLFDVAKFVQEIVIIICILVDFCLSSCPCKKGSLTLAVPFLYRDT